MKKISIDSIQEIANPLLELANLGGEQLLKMVSVGLAVGGALETIAAIIAPQIALGVAAVGTLGGMLMEYLRGRKE